MSLPRYAYCIRALIADADWLLHVSYRAISKAIKYSVTKYLIALPLVVCSASGTLSRGCRNCRPTHGPTRVLDVRITLRIRTTELYGWRAPLLCLCRVTAHVRNSGTSGDAENAGLENVGPNRRGGKDGTGKHGTKAHRWNSRDWKTQDQISWVENARPPSIEREMDKYKVERNINDMYIIL